MFNAIKNTTDTVGAEINPADTRWQWSWCARCTLSGIRFCGWLNFVHRWKIRA